MSIAYDGVKLIIIGAAVIAAGCLAALWNARLGIPVAAIGLSFTLFSAYFFRDPERNRVFEPGLIACPADGTVLSVKSEGDPGVVVVRIFLSIFNVHIQRSPIAGKVEAVKYTKGRFAVAYKPEAADNERNRIRIAAENGRFAEVEQITGAIARRIACYVKEGEAVDISEKLGMIYFGSQVAVYLPAGVKILVKPGDKVKGAETVLGSW